MLRLFLADVLIPQKGHKNRFYKVDLQIQKIFTPKKSTSQKSSVNATVSGLKNLDNKSGSASQYQ